MRRKKQFGLVLLCFAAGMIFMMFVDKMVWGIIFALVFLLLGYNLFCM